MKPVIEKLLACTRRIARLYEEQVEDLDKAFEWYGKLFLEVPTERAVQEQLLRLAPKLGKWKELGALLEEYLYDELSDRPEVLSIVRLAAELFDGRLGDRDTARKFYRRYIEALASDPKEGPRAITLFERALEQWEAWEELVELVDDLIERHEMFLDRGEVDLLRGIECLGFETFEVGVREDRCLDAVSFPDSVVDGAR